jgi:membrane dipeptidase
MRVTNAGHNARAIHDVSRFQKFRPLMLRRDFLRTMAAAAAAAFVGGRASGILGADAAVDTAAMLSVDFHSHAWRRNNFAAEMREGGMHVAVMAAVSDRPLIKREGGRQRALGSPAKGQLHYAAMRQVGDIKRAAELNDLATIRTPADVDAARLAGRPGIIIGFEGGDVFEGDLKRVNEIYAEGARLLQLVHFRVNELGDIQTEDPVHGGLTQFGSEVVRECNRLGIIIDVAHATFDVVKQVLKTTTRPVLLSHSYLTEAQRLYTRGITRAHARAVAESGGAIGIVPFTSVFPTLQHYVEGIARMVDIAGIDHVGIGSDEAGIHGGTPPFDRYDQYPRLVQLLGERGFAREDLQKIMGGNFMRVFKSVSAVS